MSSRARDERAWQMDPDEEDKPYHPCFEGYLEGAWWEVDILQRDHEKFRVRFVSPDENAWVPLSRLRLKTRPCDGWDCAILCRGMDVSAAVKHPESVDPHEVKLYDARITHATKYMHTEECCCKFEVKLFPTQLDAVAADRSVRRNSPTLQVDVSKLWMLQQVGLIPLHEILKAHVREKWTPGHLWSNDAYFLKDTRLLLQSASPGDVYSSDRDDVLGETSSEEDLTPMDLGWGSMNGNPHNVSSMFGRPGRNNQPPSDRRTEEGNHQVRNRPRAAAALGVENCEPGRGRMRFSAEEELSNLCSPEADCSQSVRLTEESRRGASKRQDPLAWENRRDRDRDMEGMRFGTVGLERERRMQHGNKNPLDGGRSFDPRPARKLRNFDDDYSREDEPVEDLYEDYPLERTIANNHRAERSAVLRPGISDYGRVPKKRLSYDWLDGEPRSNKRPHKDGRQEVFPGKTIERMQMRNARQEMASTQKPENFEKRENREKPQRREIPEELEKPESQEKRGNPENQGRPENREKPERDSPAACLKVAAKPDGQVVRKRGRPKGSGSGMSKLRRSAEKAREKAGDTESPGSAKSPSDGPRRSSRGELELRTPPLEIQGTPPLGGSHNGSGEGSKGGSRVKRGPGPSPPETSPTMPTMPLGDERREVTPPMFKSPKEPRVTDADAETLRNSRTRSQSKKDGGQEHREQRDTPKIVSRPLYLDIDPDHPEEDTGGPCSAAVTLPEDTTPAPIATATWCREECVEEECDDPLEIDHDDSSYGLIHNLLEHFNSVPRPWRKAYQKEMSPGEPKELNTNTESGGNGNCDGDLLGMRYEAEDSELDEEETKCDHKDCDLKDDVGVVCNRCGLVITLIEEIVPDVDYTQRRCLEPEELDNWDFVKGSPDTSPAGVRGYDHDDVAQEATMLKATLPPHYARQMHPHQREGFEFLWRNLARSEGAKKVRNLGQDTGCILSHAPGTGKSFLLISFLKSFMDVFPDCKPLIVAPKIMLLRWEKEFARWKSDIQIIILNLAATEGKRLLQKHAGTGLIDLKGQPPNARTNVNSYRDAMMFEWKRKRSVMLCSYNLFSNLVDTTRERKGDVGRIRQNLLKSPGILVLDEGHFPRNRGTRIRKALLAVETNSRILLSGTLFQNNFEEFFNTLYLVRPAVVEAFPQTKSDWVAGDSPARDPQKRSHFDERLSDVDKAAEAAKVAEKHARKLFVEEIGMKIEEGQRVKGSEVLQHGLQRLQQLTANFVHHHTGEVLACLPGLRDFGVLLRPTNLQRPLLAYLEDKFQRPEEYLSREIAVSEASIHPNLLTTLDFVKGDILSTLLERGLPADAQCDLAAIRKQPPDPEDGIKTKFVFDMLRALQSSNEKVLIFSQHMGPLDLLEDMFKAAFNWDKEVDVLRLDGKMALRERDVVIERFNSPHRARVLLASTRACGEGINLTGASRVIFLDVLWNPAVIKQAISRAFRLEQKKIVYVYRLIAMGSIEEKKYKKAIRKDWLSTSIFGASAQTIDVGSDDDSDGSRKVIPADEVRAWEVNASTCEDDILEKLLTSSKAEENPFVKVVEHGSQFHYRKSMCCPDAREFFVNALDDQDLTLLREEREPELGEDGKISEALASDMYHQFGETGSFDEPEDGSSDTDDEDLLR